MALTRVQATPSASATSATTLAVTFSTPPTVGHGIVVAMAHLDLAVPTCTDNQGHTYTLARFQASPTAGLAVAVFVCAVTTTTGTPFTVTVTGPTAGRAAVALDYSGVGGGLAVDQVASSAQSFPSPHQAGPTPALTTAEAALVAVVGTTGGVFITVDTPTPPWTQEAEWLTVAPMEVDSRIVSSALGTTPSATWALDGARSSATALVAVTATPGGGGAGATAQAYVWGPA